MNWKQKSRIQNLIAKIPPRLGNSAYYFLQCKFGGLRIVNPVSRLKAGIKVADHIAKQGKTVDSKVFLEIGTGHRLNLPIALWLLGAEKIITVDLNPFLKSELVFADIAYMRSHRAEIERLFDGLQSKTFSERFELLLTPESNFTTLLSKLSIQYISSADASSLSLNNKSIDYHVSFAVIDAIPPDVLEAIFHEGCRVLKSDGLFIHCIDMSDMFSHSDRTISSIHYLKFNDEEWNRIAGNRFMYQNRMRIDDYLDLFNRTGLRIVMKDVKVEDKALNEIEHGFPLNSVYANKSPETNATVTAWLVASKS